MSKRFFAFGCSCTSFWWLTWADCISVYLSSIGYECYNFGRSGAGNKYILHSLIAADLKYKFTDDDIIMVMWSSWCREDKIRRRGEADVDENGVGWANAGSVLNSKHWWPDDYIKTYWTLENDLVENVTAIYAAKKMFNLTFEGSIGHIESLDKIEHYSQKNAETNPLLQEFIKKDYDIGHTFDLLNRGTDHPTDAYFLNLDGHPQTLLHLKYVKEVIEKHTGLTLSNKESDNFITIYWNKVRGYVEVHGSHYDYEDGDKQFNVVERRTQSIRSQISHGRYELWGDDGTGDMEPNILDLLINFKNWSKS